MAKRTSIYLPDKIVAVIACGEPESASGRISHMIAVADFLVAESCPALKVGEWLAIANAANGHWPSYEQGPRGVFSSLWHSVYDSAPEANALYGIDCMALAQKLLAMPTAAQHAVFEVAAKRFWSRPDVLNAPGGYAEAFKSLGAKLAD